MKTKLLTIAALAGAIAMPAVAQGQAAVEPAPVSETAPAAPAAKPAIAVVSRGSDGLPEVVSIDGQTYKVCKGEVQDSCINPRTAGLNFGARDLQYWPGRPASEIDTPLPAEQPATLPG